MPVADKHKSGLHHRQTKSQPQDKKTTEVIKRAASASASPKQFVSFTRANYAFLKFEEKK